MSLGILVERLSEFLSQQSLDVPEADEPPAFPDGLLHIRDAFGHHLIALGLLSRSDGESVAAEQQAIADHCMRMAERHSIFFTEDDYAALTDHLRSFRPSRVQLDPAIGRLSRDTKEDIAALIEAARAVVDADSVRRPREVQFFGELSGDLSQLDA